MKQTSFQKWWRMTTSAKRKTPSKLNKITNKVQQILNNNCCKRQNRKTIKMKNIQILYMMLEVVIRETCLMGNRMALADLAHL